MDLDIPMPVDEVQQATRILQDEFASPTALTCAFIGLGQCGGRVAEAFYKLGYRSVIAVNTTPTDMAPLSLPVENKLCFHVGGAGKDPKVAAEALSSRSEDVFSFLRARFGTLIPDRVFLCFGAGGGSGAGMAPGMQKLWTEHAKRYGVESSPGAIIAWPKKTEGETPLENANGILQWLKTSNLAQIMWLDNDRVRTLYKPSASAEFTAGNTAISKLFHAFNTLAASSSDHTSFDRADLKKLMSGNVALGSQVITDWSSGSSIADAIRKAMDNSLLAPVALDSAETASLIFICGPDAYAEVSAEALDEAFDTVSRLTATTVFRGVYQGDKPGMSVLFGAGGLNFPY